jgi:hypothetical protein
MKLTFADASIDFENLSINDSFGRMQITYVPDPPLSDGLLDAVAG